jgi:hypothetical protein
MSLLTGEVVHHFALAIVADHGVLGREIASF